MKTSVWIPGTPRSTSASRRWLTASILLGAACNPDKSQSANRPEVALVFASDYRNKTGGTGIYTMAADGTNMVRLSANSVHDFQPMFSPDGKSIAFARGSTAARIYVMDSDGSDVRALTSGAYDSDPAWSPDGKKIMFTREGGAASGLYVMNADGSSPLLLLGEEGLSYRQGEFSPDGSRIVFSAWIYIYTAKSDGTDIRRITFGDGLDQEPTYSRDGSTIFFSSGREGPSRIFRVGVDGSDMRSISSGPEDYSPAVSPDGSKVAFMREVAGAASDIWTVNADGTGAVGLTNAPGIETFPAWKPQASGAHARHD